MKPRHLFPCFGTDLYFGGGVSFVWRFRILATVLSRSPLRLLAGGKALVFAVHFQNVDVMSEPVEQCTGKPFRTEYKSPFIERQVAGDERGATLIALAEHLEEQIGADRRERHIPQLIDDQQLDYVEMFLQCAQAALITCFHEFVHKGGHGREGDTVSFLTGS